MRTFPGLAAPRPRLALLAVVVLSALALAAIFALQGNAAAARKAQVDVAELQTTVAVVNAEALRASPTASGLAAAHEGVQRGGSGLLARVEHLRAEGAPAALGAVPALVRRNLAEVERMLAVVDRDPAAGIDRVRRPWERVLGSATRLSAALRDVGDAYADRARAAALQATIGTALVVLLLVGGFAWLYVRVARARAAAERLQVENERLLAATRVEARRDPLTGLGNRRALLEDLATATGGPGDVESVLVMLDLDGFKAYNDTHGHPAGDALLDRLGRRLLDALPPGARAYRLGGDEFCVLARAGGAGAADLAGAALAALEHAGEAAIAASHGIALIPQEVATPSDALRLADRRMYAHKRRPGHVGPR